MNTKELTFALLFAGLTGEKISDEVREVAKSAEAQRELFALAKSHDLAHIVGAVLSEAGVLLSASELGEGVDFAKEQMVAVMRYRRLEYELSAVCEVLEAAEIPHAPLKGSVIRAYYPKPWMRTSCDIDVLVRPQDTERAAVLLVEKLGYRRGGTGSHDVSLHAESGIHVELHYALIEDNVFNAASELLRSVWEYAAPVSEKSFRYNLSDEMFYFFHISHMAKHFVNGGCGIRPFMDLYILCHRMDYDRKKRDELLSRGALADFETAAVKLSECWFGAAEYDELSLSMEQFLLTGGVYGGIGNQIAVNQVREGGKFKYAMSKIFLPYDIIKFYYPTLQKHRWLTPVYQVRRWFKLLFCGGARRSAKTLRKNSSISATEAARTEKMLASLGIESK